MKILLFWNLMNAFIINPTSIFNVQSKLTKMETKMTQKHKKSKSNISGSDLGLYRYVSLKWYSEETCCFAVISIYRTNFKIFKVLVARNLK